MTLRRITTAVAVAALASAAIAPTAASASPLGTDSLAAVLTSDGNQFDNDWSDFDIVTEAVLAVLAAKPGSAVGVLADGTTPVTAFVPTDRAFQLLVQDLTGKRMMSEKAIFTTLAGAVGIDGVESVLLYHVVPGATITAKQAKAADGAMLNTALPGGIDQGAELLDVGPARRAAGLGQERPQPLCQDRRGRHQQGQPADRPRDHPGAPPDGPLTWPPGLTRHAECGGGSRPPHSAPGAVTVGRHRQSPRHLAGGRVRRWL